MRFLVVSAVIHKKVNGNYAGYAPYVREMNLWFRHVDEVRVIAPMSTESPDPLESFYQHSNFTFVRVPAIDLTTFKSALLSIFALPYILYKIFLGMIWANHIHLRCPANMGLLGAFVQIFFPSKPKTVKYANNWDWNSKQSVTYRLQQHILRNEFLTRNTRVLVYGNWNEQSQNILPFYTASYSKEMQLPTEPRAFSANEPVKLLFVGTLTENKRPLTCVMVAEKLIKQGYKIELELLGDGYQRSEIESYIKNAGLSTSVFVRGKVNPTQVIDYFRSSHFLVFLSMSEGWPKVVAEAMWWGCLPITTNVSCVTQMVGNGERGVVVEPSVDEVVDIVKELLHNGDKYSVMCKNAINWARMYHLERFEDDVVKLLNNSL
jgi:glycosyltransferase involved in cell wall biosynthesis